MHSMDTRRVDERSTVRPAEQDDTHGYLNPGALPLAAFFQPWIVVDRFISEQVRRVGKPGSGTSPR